ncbi:protein RETICULATA-RELATED 1, chloroplastic-like [Quillaja saponaria]|uniref:Protein RETICULATA-RELATED 1, chloroplastic-like n=1 Tax=Quillaja saponaria TaxID=32244 RepID=A0AAD7PV74_QUISA|nr:protein RETICULATA-RELATED 1, chloroplastic-like [Quillaja saponaria]
MSLVVFQTAQIMPMNTQINTKTLLPKPLLPIPKLATVQKVVNPAAVKLRWRGLVLKASSSSLVGGNSAITLERCFAAPAAPGNLDSFAPSSSLPSCSPTSFSPVMKGQYGSLGSVTLEKSKLDMTQKQTKSSPQLDIGGGGGGIGKKINHGGGDGGDDDGDDDDYFDDFDDGDEGDEGGLFRRRIFLEELFDRKFVDAVLNEWQRTIMDLPAGFRQAYEMGLVSSAQMVKFLAINARPTTTRFISRSLPQGISRAFIGRMLADPAFLYKLLLEQAATIGSSVWWELNNRKDRIKQEWDLALVNVLTAAACNAVVVWSLAPCRSYGNTFQFDLQNTLQKLPNNIFEKSYPLREFDLQKRIHSFFFKAAELCMVGLSAGAVQGALSNFLASKKEERLSVTIPTVSSNALGYGAFLGLYTNLRYQLVCGFDRAMINHFDVIGVALFFSTALRIMNVRLGETSRRVWLGVEADPLAQSDNLLKAYNRPSENVDQTSSKWFISKNAVVSGLGLLGIKQVNADSVNDAQPSAPKARRKRVVRKKVAAGSA